MNEHLIEMERKAFALINSGRMQEASTLFEKIIKEIPSWEHGYGFYNLAGCYEEIQELDKARAAYKIAIEYDKNNSMFVGAYASFLYLYGKTTEAFEWYLNLLRLEYSQGNQKSVNDIKNMLLQLAEKLNYTKQDIDSFFKGIIN